MFQVITASRLHFGLLSPGEPISLLSGQEPKEESQPTRVWGGIGLMVQKPGITLQANLSSTWQASGPLGARILQHAREVMAILDQNGQLKNKQPLQFQVSSASEHCGLGTGTQLALGVASIICKFNDVDCSNCVELARMVGRGKRSAIGIHGFSQGGFLVDGGKAEQNQIAPLISRMPFPEDWRVLLVLPKESQGLHGQEELQAMTNLRKKIKDSQVDILCRLVVLGILPALVENCFDTFSRTLFEFNYRVGEMFQSVQGGIYSHPLAEPIIDFLKSQNIHGVGQSSWGPTLFVLTQDQDVANTLSAKLLHKFQLDPSEILITKAANQGAKGR